MHDVLHLILRQKLSPSARVTELPARVAFLAVLGKQRLGLLARLLRDAADASWEHPSTAAEELLSELAAGFCSDARNRSSARNRRSMSPIKNSTHRSRPES